MAYVVPNDLSRLSLYGARNAELNALQMSKVEFVPQSLCGRIHTPFSSINQGVNPQE